MREIKYDKLPSLRMKCERCREDTVVDRYDVDGFTGYLCEECREQWERL